jgi:hypothetical protein
MNPEQLLDDDFSDLDEIISRDESKRAENRHIAAASKRLAKGGLSETDRIALLAEVRRYEDTHIWTTVAAVALFHTQECLGCGHRHRFFLGWMTQQDHKRDTHCRRFIRGKPIETVPTRMEEHIQPPVEMCGDCAECSIELLQIIESINRNMKS